MSKRFSEYYHRQSLYTWLSWRVCLSLLSETSIYFLTCDGHWKKKDTVQSRSNRGKQRKKDTRLFIQNGCWLIYFFFRFAFTLSFCCFCGAYDNIPPVIPDELSYIPLGKRLETYLAPPVFTLIFGIGLIGNGTLMLIFLRNKAMRSVPNIYIMSLSLGDLFVITGKLLLLLLLPAVVFFCHCYCCYFLLLFLLLSARISFVTK